MINYEKQYNNKNNTCYADDYVDYDPAMTVSKNTYVNEDYLQNDTQTKTSTADFEEMISTASAGASTAQTDLYPSPTTMQFVGSKEDRRYIYEDFSDADVSVDEDDESAYKINTKGKVMIAVYALVVLTIFALIIMNTRLIKNMNESINEQEMRIEALMQEQQALQAQYQFVSSDEEVLRKAAEMGMVRG